MPRQEHVYQPTFIISPQPDDVFSLNDMSDDATIWKKKDRIIILNHLAYTGAGISNKLADYSPL